MCDSNVYAPARKSRILVRDNPTFQVGTEQTRFFETTFSAFDGYGQPQVVHEAGYNGATVYPGDSVLEATRTTTYTYSHVDDASTHIVLGRPTTKVVCLDGGNDCFTSTWTYDGTGYQKDSESVAGVVTRFAYYPFADSYNGGGNLQSITNAKGQTLTLSGYREQYGVPATLDFNGEFAIRRTASPQGWVLTQTDGRNNTTAKAHDAIGRPTSIVLPSATWPGDSNSLSTLVTYPADLCWTGGANAKCVIQATKGAYVKQTEVDGLGRPIRVSDSQGVTQSFVYNSSGQRTFESYPWDSSTGEIGDFVSYDSLGRSSARSRAYRIDGKYSGVRSDYWFQPLANCLKTTVIRSTAGTNDSYNTVQCEKWFGDLDTGLLWEAVDGTFAAWWYDYNAAGKMTALMAPDEAGDRAFAYDSRQFLASETTGESGTTVNTANQLNQIATRTDARGVVASYDYDATLSRLAGVRYDSSTSESWSQHFDKANNVQDVASLASGAYVFEYDEQNRVRRQTWTAPADWNGGVPVSYVTSFDYDSKGCQIGITYPSGLRVGMTCDTANRVRTVAVNGTLIATVLSYHPTGQIASVRYESTPPLTLTYSYDALGRMASMKDPGVVDLAYGYNGADNLTSLCRDSGDVTNPPCLQTSPPPSLVRTFGYDDANRLLTAIAPSAWGTLVFDYDWLGNRIFKSGDLSTTFVFDRNNRLESAVGPEPLPSMTLTWNAAGRLASSSQDGAAYAYNARGWRVLKKSANESVVYHHDPAGNVLSESTQDGTRQRDFIYLGGRLLLVDSCNPATSPICAEREWYHTDSLGSVLARTNASGAVTTISDYQPWGEGFGTAGTLGDRQYNGRVYDAGTGFHDYGARMYWPQIGRFISADSVMGSPGSPMTLNRYSYVLNNPYKYTDPTGRETQLAVGLNTANNVFGHVAIIINGQVYSYGTNYTQGGKYAQDWGGDASAYLDAQASARQTQLMTLATDAGQESALKAYLDANNPNAKGAPKYDLLSNSCVTASEDALVASGVLPNQIVLPNALNTPPPGSKWAKATTPGDLGSKAKTAGIVKDSKTVGTSAGPTVQSASGTVRAASDRSSP
jgi:RHS repeat-associated protein